MGAATVTRFDFIYFEYPSATLHLYFHGCCEIKACDGSRPGKPGSMTNGAEVPTDTCPEKEEGGKGKSWEMGLKTKEWQWANEEN